MYSSIFYSDFLNEIPIWIYCLCIFIFSFVVSNKLIPLIIITVNYKNLMDNPNDRSSHVIKTPTLGGIAFFGSLMISLFFIDNFDQEDLTLSLIVAVTILFFLGLKDDLMVLSSKTKILLQTAAILFALSNPNLRIYDFHGFFEIGEFSVWLGILLAYILILYIINAYNLIDGIDGLAGFLGVSISMIYTIFFFKIGMFYYALIGIVIIGFLLAFLRFNVSKKRKIFMGDTGSMIVGLLIGVLTIRFLSLEAGQLEIINILPENVFIVSVSILFFPVIDVIRVIFARLLKGKGAFTPDRGHMHHIFVDKGLSHITASLTLLISGIIPFFIIYSINTYLNYLGLIIVFFIITFLTYYILLLLDKDEIAIKHRKRVKRYIPEKIYLREFQIRKRIIVFLKSIFFKDLL